MVALPKLAGVIGPLGLLTGVMGLLNHQKKHADAMAHPMIVEAIERLKSNPSAQLVLGEPISIKKIDLTNSDLNHFDEVRGRFELSAYGPKGKGTLKTQVIRLNANESPPWKIQRLELKIHYTSELQPEEYRNKSLLLHDVKSKNTSE